MNRLIRRCILYESYRISESYNTYDTQTWGSKWVFLLKFVVLFFFLNKFLDFFNKKLLRNLIKSNKIASP